MDTIKKLVKIKSLWVGLSLICIALGSGLADNDWNSAGNYGAKAIVEILAALGGAGIITLRLGIEKVIQRLDDREQ